jgi:hypothetical protein
MNTITKMTFECYLESSTDVLSGLSPILADCQVSNVVTETSFELTREASCV